MNADLLSAHHASVHAWLRVWDTPELADETTVEWSARLTRSLGRCDPRRGIIRIAAYLESAKPSFLEEVLCHELAHLAARKLHGDTIRPHGREWKSLMRAAGYEPKTRLPAPSGFLRHRIRAKARKPRRSSVYVHRCHVCQAARAAKRSMPRWRCAACVDAGLDGVLAITRLTP